ncbi:MAG TPA: MauE/DoxX family redox-associated membrane protein [Pyrinomonadaceae bacterium]|jgi:hypothetical protein
MSRLRLLKLLVQISRFGLAALFLFAAGAKLYTLREFVANVSNLVWLGWEWPVALLVIALELIAALLLIIPRTVRLGGFWSAVLLLGFAAYALYYTQILHGEPLECGCFGGIIASQLGVSTALRNLGLLLPALLIIFAYPRLRRIEDKGAEAPQAAPPLIEHERT